MARKLKCPHCNTSKFVIPIYYGDLTDEVFLKSKNNELSYQGYTKDIHKWFCINCDKKILPTKPNNWTKKHFEKPFLKIRDKYENQLQEAYEKYKDKLTKICSDLGQDRIASDLHFLCLWLTLGYNERLELSQKLRKNEINIIQVCINKVDSILEEGSGIDLYIDSTFPQDYFRTARINLYNRLEETKNSKAGHLKEIVEGFSIVAIDFKFQEKRQKQQIDFIFSVMKAFDFEWTAKAFKVFKGNECIASFEDGLYAQNYISESECSPELKIREAPLTIHDLDEGVVKTRIRTQIQQTNAKNYKTSLDELKQMGITI
jgi:hypothetical protein